MKAKARVLLVVCAMIGTSTASAKVFGNNYAQRICNGWMKTKKLKGDERSAEYAKCLNDPDKYQ